MFAHDKTDFTETSNMPHEANLGDCAF